MKLLVRANIGHFLHGVYILATLLLNDLASAQSSKIGRAPANFVPDDDLIEVPMVYEKGILDDFHKENKQAFTQSKKSVEFWQTQSELAEAYGLENRGIYITPNQQQRQNFMQRNYLRFLTQRIERNSNQGIANAWEEWTTDDEIDSLKNYEEHEEYIIKAKKERGGSVKLDKTQKVKVGKKEFKVDFQPRLEMGMVKVQVKSSYFNLKAWVGVNGNQEVQAYKKFSTGTDIQARYYIDQGRVLAAVDQDLNQNWSLRFSHDRTLEESDNYDLLEHTENNILQLRFSMGF